jgi:hypothetical protein
MGRNVGWKSDVKTSPGLAFFLPGIYFPKLEPLTEKEKRGRKIVPDGIASEIKGVQVVPIEMMAEAAEGSSGILSRSQNLAPFGLDTNRFSKKQPLLLFPGKRTEKDAGCCRR